MSSHGDLVVLQSVQVHPPVRAQPRMLAADGRREHCDEELSRLGSAGAEALFHRHHAALYRFCLGILSNSDEAADVTQTVWERAFVAFSKPDAPPVLKVRPWLYAVARNECLDVMRARGAQQTLDVTELELSGGVVTEERVEQRAALQLLLDDLSRLSERQRSALVLRELGGLDAEELASTLETSPARALSLVAEARHSLVARRDGRGMPCSAAQRELGRLRRRSSAVQSHLDSCSDCRAFERGRRGRKLSSLALSPPLFVQDLAAQLSALFPAAPPVVAKTAVAATIAASGVGFGGPAAHRAATRDAPPQKADIRNAADRPAPHTHRTQEVRSVTAPKADSTRSPQSVGRPPRRITRQAAAGRAPRSAASTSYRRPPLPDPRPATARPEGAPTATPDAPGALAPAPNVSVDIPVDTPLAPREPLGAAVQVSLHALPGVLSDLLRP